MCRCVYVCMFVLHFLFHCYWQHYIGYLLQQQTQLNIVALSVLFFHHQTKTSKCITLLIQPHICRYTHTRRCSLLYARIHNCPIINIGLGYVRCSIWLHVCCCSHMLDFYEWLFISKVTFCETINEWLGLAWHGWMGILKWK